MRLKRFELSVSRLKVECLTTWLQTHYYVIFRDCFRFCFIDFSSLFLIQSAEQDLNLQRLPRGCQIYSLVRSPITLPAVLVITIVTIHERFLLFDFLIIRVPVRISGPRGARTLDLLINSQALPPAELQAHIFLIKNRLSVLSFRRLLLLNLYSTLL